MPKSAVVRLLDLTWANANTEIGHSYERLNHAMRESLSMAIETGFRFAKNDVRFIIQNYRSGYWIGESTEWIYADAIRIGNASAYTSYEQWCGRTPMIADDVKLPLHHSAFKHLETGRRKQCRLAVGFSFPYHGRAVTVTSFKEDHVVACAYRPGTNKVARRHKITREDLINNRAVAKEHARLMQWMTVQDPPTINKLQRRLRKLNAKSQQEIASLSTQALKEIVDDVCPIPDTPTTITEDHLKRALAENTGCNQVVQTIQTYQPGMKVSKIKEQHRRWLRRNNPKLAQELGIA